MKYKVINDLLEECFNESEVENTLRKYESISDNDKLLLEEYGCYGIVLDFLSNVLIMSKSIDEKRLLLDAFKKANYNMAAYTIAIDKELSKKYSLENIILFIENVRDFYNYTQDSYNSFNITSLLNNRALIKFRTFDEIIACLELLVRSGSNSFVLSMLKNPVLLANRNHKEQLQLIRIYIKSRYNEKIEDIILNNDSLILDDFDIQYDKVLRQFEEIEEQRRNNEFFFDPIDYAKQLKKHNSTDFNSKYDKVLD